MADRGVIIGGPAQWGWPVLEELRYPRLVERLGPLPHLLEGRAPVPRFVEQWLRTSPAAADPMDAEPSWVAWWKAADDAGWRATCETLSGAWGVPAAVHRVVGGLPPAAAMHWANSLAIRDGFEFGGGVSGRAFVNVGVNGIDGTLSTALGEAWARPDRPLCLITGDLAFLHDQGGLLASPDVPGRVTAVVVDDAGGGIFRTPDLATDADPAAWERFFVTPHHTDIAAMCAAHGVPAVRVRGGDDLMAAVLDDLERPGLGVVVADVRQCDDSRLRALARAAAVDAIDAMAPPS